MTQDRASIFDNGIEDNGLKDNGIDFDVSGFMPKKAKTAPTALSVETLKAVSEAAQFPSREPVKKTNSAAKVIVEPEKREMRRYRTGRNVQLNIKVKSETLDSFYQIADREGWVLGETLERAVAALKEKISAQK